MKQSETTYQIEKLKEENARLKQELEQFRTARNNADEHIKYQNITDAREFLTAEPAHHLMKSIAWFSCLMVFTISSINLVGWRYDISLFKSVQPNWAPMKMITAWGLIFLSLAFLLIQSKQRIKWKYIVAKISGIIVALAGFITIVLYLVTYQTEITIYDVPFLNHFFSAENRMALASAILFVFIGWILYILSLNDSQKAGLAHALMIPVLIIAYIIPVSYILGHPAIYQFLNLPISIYTGINICLLSAAILLFYPETWLMKIFVYRYSGGLMARKLLPGIFLLPIIIGWLKIYGESSGWFVSEIGTILTSVTYTFCLLGLLWFTAKSVNKIDKTRQSLHASLLLSEEKFSAAFRSNPHAIVLSRVKDGTIIDVNDAFLTFFERTKEEVIGNTSVSLNMFADPEDRDKALTLLRTEGRVRNFELKIRSRSGRERIAFLSAEIMQMSQEKTMLTTIQDITESKQAESKIHELLRLSERRTAELNAVIDSMPEAVYIGTKEGITQCNTRALQMLGASSLQDLQNRIGELGLKFNIRWPDTGRQLREDELQFTRALKGETVVEEVLATNAQTGKDVYIRAADAPIMMNGEIIGAVAINADITDRVKAEEEAIVRSTEIEAILSCIADGVIVYDKEGRIIRSNSTADKMLKYPKEETELPMHERVSRGYGVWTEDGHKLNSEEMPAYRAAVHGETIRNQVVLMKAGSEPHWINISAAPLMVEGKHMGGVASMSDITERKKAEAALQEKEQRLRGIFDNAAVGITETDAKDHFLDVNERLCIMLGYTREELKAKNVYELTYPDDRPQTIEMNKRLHEGEFRIFNYEKRYVKKDGTPVWVHVTASAIMDSRDNFIKSINTIEDITERKHAEETVRRSETILKQAGNMANLGAWEVEFNHSDDVNKNPLYWSEQVYRIFGYEPGSVPASNDLFFEHVHPDDRRKVSDAVAEAIKNKGSYNLEHRIVRTDGQERMVDEHAEIVYDDFGKPLRITGAVQDITEQKRIEIEMKQKNEELTRFIYTVSHDLKSPLVTIKMFTSYLRDDFNNNPTREQFEKNLGYIENAADKMGKLLDDILQLSRIGRKEEFMTEVRLEKIVKEAVDLVAGRISQKNVKVIFTAPPVLLFGYTQRFLQLYQNLLDNAVKFMGEQPNPQIEIGAYADNNRNNEIILFVRDNGIGIEPELQHKLFGLFEKLNPKAEGTGIGLALVKRIVEVHGGRIWVFSEGYGKGTTFYFTLGKTRLLKD